MRGTVAKKYRRICRALSKETTETRRSYRKHYYDKDRKKQYFDATTLVYSGYRRIYQDMKKAHRKGGNK